MFLYNLKHLQPSGGCGSAVLPASAIGGVRQFNDAEVANRCRVDSSRSSPSTATWLARLYKASVPRSNQCVFLRVAKLHASSSLTLPAMNTRV
jgi:hypothetical protein